MASNGYVRWNCSRCIFYRTDRELGHECTVQSERWGLPANRMQWVSATDCDRNPEIEEKHYERCEHFFGKSEIKIILRKAFGIDILEE